MEMSIEGDNQKQILEKRKIVASHMNEERDAIQKKSYTSFGKLILAEEKSNPIYSIGTADRFAVTGDIIEIPKDTPGPQYEIPEVTKYKYTTSHKWRIGSARRPPLNPKEKFSYYNHVDKGKTDYPKKWDHIIGGAIPLEAKVKYDFREKTPGPGRYEPQTKAVRPKTPSYFIAEKTNASSIKMLTGTNENVGPGKYRVESAKYTSKHKLFPKYTIGNDKRKPLYNKGFAKNETYYVYSSCGNQVMSKKRTESRAKIGKATRDRENNRGVFKSMMERQPTRISIPMPKF